MPDRSTAPALQHTLELTLPPFNLFLDRPGLEGILVPSDRQQVVRVEILLRGGTIEEPATGISGFTCGMLDKGTTHRSAAEVAATLDFYSAHLSVMAGSDFVNVTLFCLTRNLKNVLPLLFEILASPAFDEDEFRISRDIYLQNLSVNLEKNSYVAGKNLRKLVYGDHPYGRHVSAEDASAVTTGQLRKFFTDAFKPWKVFISGCIEPADLDTIRQQLPLAGPVLTTGLQVPVFGGPSNIRTEKADAVQCSIRMGKPCIDRTAADYPALLLANHLLGGFFGSRLMKNIREEKGLTYGIHSSMQHMQFGGMLSIGADVNKDKLEPAMEAIREELLGMDNLTQEELTTARNHLIGSFQNDLNTIFAGADRIMTIRVNDLSPDHYGTLVRSLDRLSTEQVRDAAVNYFSPDSFAIAVAG